MSETTQNATTEAKAAKGKAQKKAAKPKAAAANAKTSKTPKAEKPKRDKAPRESRDGWGTFALKMPVAEREAFHAASGAAGASRFARIVLNAFSHDDTAAFEAAIDEAKKLR